MNTLSKEDLNYLIKGKNIRLATEDDIYDLADLMAKEWDLGSKYADCDRAYASLIYARLIYASSQYLFVYTNDKNEVIGFVGYANRYLRSNFIKNYDKHIKEYDKMLNSEDAGIGGKLREYFNNGDNIEEGQHKISNNYLEILIVNNDYRNEGIADILMDLVESCIKKLRDLNPENDVFNELSVYTTDTCSYSYYDKCGYKVVVNFYDKFYGEEIYIYSKDVV